MISNGEGGHNFAVKRLSVLLREIMLKHVGDFYSLNCLHSFRTKTGISQKICQNKYL